MKEAWARAQCFDNTTCVSSHCWGHQEVGEQTNSRSRGFWNWTNGDQHRQRRRNGPGFSDRTEPHMRPPNSLIWSLTIEPPQTPDRMEVEKQFEKRIQREGNKRNGECWDYIVSTMFEKNEECDESGWTRGRDGPNDWEDGWFLLSTKHTNLLMRQLERKRKEMREQAGLLGHEIEKEIETERVGGKWTKRCTNNSAKKAWWRRLMTQTRYTGSHDPGMFKNK